jgi:hypothetical protein
MGMGGAAERIEDVGSAIRARRIAANLARLPPYFLAGSSTFPDFGSTR